jgi:hypothetical protein
MLFYFIRVNVDNILNLVPTYAKLADLRTGLCYLDSFSKNLSLAVSEPVVKLFELIDKVSVVNIFICFTIFKIKYLKTKNGQFGFEEFADSYFKQIASSSTDEEINKNVEKTLSVSLLYFLNVVQTGFYFYFITKEIR